LTRETGSYYKTYFPVILNEVKDLNLLKLLDYSQKGEDPLTISIRKKFGFFIFPEWPYMPN